MKKLIFLITLITSASLLIANEIIPIWNNSAKANIQDMEIMPGGDEFILTTHDATIEIRSTEDGSLIQEYVDTSNLFVAGDIEFTPDSNRIILGVSGLLQILDLETFERQGYFAFGPDTIARGFSNLVVDPIRPLVYATINGFEKTSGNNNPIGKIQAYNYETMEPVRNLTEYGNSRYEALAISDDGQYLATINGGIKAYLKIWDLSTNELIVNKPLFDKNSERKCEPYDIVFSNINKNIIYISGFYTEKVHPNDKGGGLYKYNFIEDLRELLIPNENYGAWNLDLFDNESRIFISHSFTLGVINFYTNQLELYITPPDNVYPINVRYFEESDIFLSTGGNKTSCFKYERETSVETDQNEEIKISPNPTNNFININIECSEPSLKYRIFDLNSILMTEETFQMSTEGVRIDFSMYPPGVYFLRFVCNNQHRSYKIIKEG